MHLKELTNKDSWMDVPLDDFKTIIRTIVRKNQNRNEDYYSNDHNKGKKKMHALFRDAERKPQGMINIAKALFIPRAWYTLARPPIEACFPKQHGRLVFAALLILSWINDDDAEFTKQKNKLFSTEDIKMKISNYYTEDDKPRLELKIKELDNIVTAWAEKTPINLGDKE